MHKGLDRVTAAGAQESEGGVEDQGVQTLQVWVWAGVASPCLRGRQTGGRKWALTNMAA